MSKDYKTYQQVGLSNLYEIAGNLNLFMVCETLSASALSSLADGYSFRLCRRGELEAWKRIATDEQYVGCISEFYNNVYAKDEDEFFKRCTLACDAYGKPIAACLFGRLMEKLTQLPGIGYCLSMRARELGGRC
jgi:hypothetical protein